MVIFGKLAKLLLCYKRYDLCFDPPRPAPTLQFNGIYFLSLRAGQRARQQQPRPQIQQRTVHLVGRRHAMMLLYFHVGQSGS